MGQDSNMLQMMWKSMPCLAWRGREQGAGSSALSEYRVGSGKLSEYGGVVDCLTMGWVVAHCLIMEWGVAHCPLGVGSGKLSDYRGVSANRCALLYAHPVIWRMLFKLIHVRAITGGQMAAHAEFTYGSTTGTHQAHQQVQQAHQQAHQQARHALSIIEYNS